MGTGHKIGLDSNPDPTTYWLCDLGTSYSALLRLSFCTYNMRIITLL